MSDQQRQLEGVYTRLKAWSRKRGSTESIATVFPAMKGHLSPSPKLGQPGHSPLAMLSMAFSAVK